MEGSGHFMLVGGDRQGEGQGTDGGGIWNGCLKTGGLKLKC